MRVRVASNVILARDSFMWNVLETVLTKASPGTQRKSERTWQTMPEARSAAPMRRSAIWAR